MSAMRATATAGSLAGVMAQALAIEREAADRYGALADVMEVHNNRDVAALFRKMADIEARHAAQIMAEMGWQSDADVPAPLPSWGAADPPESVPEDEIHYLMWPWHALQLALAAERRAEAFFAHLADSATDDDVRRIAVELRDEEREHVELVQRWLERTPEPGTDWAHDPDPPRYGD